MKTSTWIHVTATIFAALIIGAFIVALIWGMGWAVAQLWNLVIAPFGVRELTTGQGVGLLLLKELLLGSTISRSVKKKEQPKPTFDFSNLKTKGTK